MTTKLDGLLKRELSVLGEPYTLTLSPDGLKLSLRGRRKGFELAWADLVSGDAALATALNASLASTPEPQSKPPNPKPRNAEPSAGGASKSPRRLKSSG